MPFYQDSVYGPPEPSQMPPVPSPTSSPLHDRPRPAEERPFRIPRELTSPASSPIPISPTYHSYRDDNDAPLNEAVAGAEAEEEADELVSADEHYSRRVYQNGAMVRDSAHRHRQRRTRVNSSDDDDDGNDEAGEEEDSIDDARRFHSRPRRSEKYLSLPRDAGAFEYVEQQRSRKKSAPSRTVGDGEVEDTRRRDGLVSSRPRATPHKGNSSSVDGRLRHVSPPKGQRSTANNSRRRSAQEGGIRRNSSDSSSSEDEEEDVLPPPPPSHRAPKHSSHYRDPAVVDAAQSPHVRRPSARAPTPPSRSSSSDDASPTPPSRSHHRRHSRRQRSPSSQPPPPPAPPVYCAKCGYPLPEEMEVYVEETSSYASVPRPHCPACGSRLRPAMKAGLTDARSSKRTPQRVAPEKHSSSDDADSSACEDVEVFMERPSRREHQEGTPARRTPQQPAAVSSPPRRSPIRNQDVEVNLYSDAEGADSSSDEAEGREVRPQQRRRPPVPTSLPPPPPHTQVLIPKPPYLTLESMPQSLVHTLRHEKNRQAQSSTSDGDAEAVGGGTQPPRHHRRRRYSVDVSAAGVPWATPGCSACRWQCGAGLAGLCCCCAMPCVLFRERQQLLFHEVESRYICCAGAFPCCVPPPSLRPELYFTVKTEGYEVPTTAAVAPSRPSGRRGHKKRYWGNAVEVSRESSSSDDDEDSDDDVAYDQPRRSSLPVSAGRTAALYSATGIASPASLVNPCTGLPLEGCYRNTAERGGTRTLADGRQVPTGAGCCGCIACVDHTCVLDGSSGCCLTCRHPTAHCLACPLCCLCCELTCCMPCALWANRLLLRQHYHLAPDPVIDGGAACCYACCLQCCTCRGISVVREHHNSYSPYQRRTAAKAAAGPSPLSCWSQLATSVAACLAAVCCLCPCAACSLAQQRDQMQRLGFPLVVEVPPEMEMM